MHAPYGIIFLLLTAMMVVVVVTSSSTTTSSKAPFDHSALVARVHAAHLERAKTHGFRAMPLESTRAALAYLASGREGPQLPPPTLLHPWNPGARCAPKADLIGEVDPVCLDVSDYDMVYMDDFTPIRNQIANGAAALLFVAGGAECSIASAWAVCPAMVSPCLPDVPVPGSVGNELVALNVPTCLHLCNMVLENCIREMIDIFQYDNETAHETLRCAVPHGNPLFYGATDYDIFPAAADPASGNNTIVQLVNVSFPDGTGNGTEEYSFEHVHECFDGTIGAVVDLAVLNCPSGLVRDDATGFCHFECPEPLVSSSEYEALKALVTLGAALSAVSLLFAIAVYCVVPVLRRYPNDLAVPLFVSLLGLSLSLLLGAVDGYHEGTWCSDSGSPNEWGSGTCTVQGMGIVYFSFASALWWLLILFHLASTRGIPTFRRPKQTADLAPMALWSVTMRMQRRYMSMRIPFEWIFNWARRTRESEPKTITRKQKRQSTRIIDITGSSSSSNSSASDDSPPISSDDDESDDDGGHPKTIVEWPSLPKCLQRKLRRRALGVRIYGYTLVAHIVAWGLSLIPVIIGLSAKRIGYGGADLWCTVHSGADISFRVTTAGGVVHDQEHETNPWLLGLYIAPIFAVLLAGSLLVVIVIFSGCSVMAFVVVRRRAKGLLRNLWPFVAEWSNQVRLLVFAAVFLLVYVLQLLWLAYFSAIRPEQYDKFSAYMLCTFRMQGPTEHAPTSCSLDRIVNVGFWGFTAFTFASLGLPVAFIFLLRPEPFRWLWHLVRHCRPIITMDSWERHFEDPQSSPSSIAGGASADGEPSYSSGEAKSIHGRPLHPDEVEMRKSQMSTGQTAFGGDMGFVDVRGNRKKLDIANLLVTPVKEEEEEENKPSTQRGRNDAPEPRRASSSITSADGIGLTIAVSDGSETSTYTESGDSDS